MVLNRAESGKFPETPCAVVAEGCQFSYRGDGRPETLAVRADRDAAFVTAKAVLAGAVADPTNGALFFRASRIRPGWFESRIRVGEIGNHAFYRYCSKKGANGSPGPAPTASTASCAPPAPPTTTRRCSAWPTASTPARGSASTRCSPTTRA